MNTTPPAPSADRHQLVDVLRSVALLGILVVNLEFLASAPFLGWEGRDAWWDLAARWVGITFFQLKSYLVFAVLFGYGLAIMASRDRDGRLGGRYARRMVVLAVLGVLHAVFFFVGDILFTYAVIGSLLFAVRHWATARLLRLAGWLFGIATALVGLVCLVIAAGGATDDPGQAARTAVYADGTFLEVAAQRVEDTLIALVFGGLLQWASIASAFCVGLALGRGDLLAHPARHVARARRVMRWALPVGFGACGVAGVLTLAADARDGWLPAAGLMIQHLAAPVAVAGVLALGIVIAGTRSWWPRAHAATAAGGAASLSVYLGESVIASLVFNGYGLGLVGDVGPALALLFALAIWGALEWGMRAWRAHFRQGPMEWLLRSATYLRWAPLRRAAAQRS